MLSDVDIHYEMTGGDLDIWPFHTGNLQPASYDVRLDQRFKFFKKPQPGDVLDPNEDISSLMSDMNIVSGTILLAPGEFALGSTVEKVSLSTRLAARLEGKSSLGRLGLMVHSTAGFIDPGFSGTITLELSNVGRFPVLLHPGMKIGQLCVFRLDTPASAGYGDPKFGSKYQGQEGPVASRSWRKS